jgi:carboxypeptidase Taq
MKPTKKPFDKLFELSKAFYAWRSVQELLEWDQEVMMPPAAIDYRAYQSSLVAGQIHTLKTEKKFSSLLKKLIDIESGAILDPSLSHEECAALRSWRRDHLLATKLSSSFVKKWVILTTTSCHLWAKARKASDFSLFAPHLDKIVQMNRKKADLLGYQDHPYDALIDLYEVGMTTKLLSPLFERLKHSLKELLKQIQARPKPDQRFLNQEFSPEVQLQFGRKLLKHLGFLPENSRLDLSTHPFCTGLHPLDSRMTTRIHSNDVMSSIFSTLHEGGHAMYNQGLPLKWVGSPLSESDSLGIDESQSRWWETRIGRSRPFWSHCLPLLHKDFPQLKGASLDSFYAAINTVSASFIRIEADEVTYNLHIILRFEIEKALMEGSLKVKEIPDVWNQKMHELLGITPANAAEGCLQDIHWALGSLGYFPTYALGNLYASQFFTTFEKAHPDWQERLAQGHLDFIREWLRLNIHQWGRQFSPSELIEKVTGKPLDETAYIDYLHKKYQELYP